MSVQSDAAKRHIESLFVQAYPINTQMWMAEYAFARLDMKRGWRFDYADFACRCAIELDGGTFQSKRTGHASGTGLRAWREKNNAAMAAGWRVWHYAPEEVIKAGRKTLPDEPILKELPWLTKREKQSVLTASPAKLSERLRVPSKHNSTTSTLSLVSDSAQGACKKRTLSDDPGMNRFSYGH